MQQSLDDPGEPSGDDFLMRPLYTRLQEARRGLAIPWEILERDYLLSWVLAGIGQAPALRDTLVFKGGTALRKCYFGDYRFYERFFSRRPCSRGAVGAARGHAITTTSGEFSVPARTGWT